MLERLNAAAILLNDDAQLVRIGQVMKFDENGNRLPFVFAATGTIKAGLGRMRARARASGPAVSPQESRMQKWFRDAETNDVRADLFIHLVPGIRVE
jgi:hypothetical protein